MVPVLLAGFILAVTIFLFLVVIGSELFTIMADEQLNHLRLSIHDAPPPVTDRVLSFPEPVSRYLSSALIEKRNASGGSVRIRHAGRIRFGQDGRWMPVRGEAVFPLEVPGFVWRSTIRYAPGIWLEAFDYYVDRAAAMNLNIYSVFPLNNGQTDALLERSLFRYLACTPLFPQVHATSSFIRWENADETGGKAVICANGRSAEAIVRFDSRGGIGSIEACNQPDPDTGHPAPGYYICRFSSCTEAGQFRIPLRMVTEIILPEGDRVCAEYHITAVDYESSGVPAAESPS